MVSDKCLDAMPLSFITQDEYIRHLKVDDVVLRQKASIHWIKYGDANSKNFHNIIRGRKSRLFIHKVKNEDGEWIQWGSKLVIVSCKHFHEIFTGKKEYIQENVLYCIPKLLSDVHNDSLQAMPTIYEVKHVVFYMNAYSTTGLDCMNGKFFQSC